MHSRLKNMMKKLNWLRLTLPVVVVVAAMVIVILKAAPTAFVGIFSDPGAFATFFGAILATLGIPYGVWLSASYERRRKKGETKAENANEILALVSIVIHEVIENFRFPIGKSEGEAKALTERYNDLSLRLSEALHRANYILDPKDLEPYGRLKSLIEKFNRCKRAEWYNQNRKESQIYLPYPLTEYMSILYKNPESDTFGSELREAQKQIEQVFKKYVE